MAKIWKVYPKPSLGNEMIFRDKHTKQKSERLKKRKDELRMLKGKPVVPPKLAHAACIINGNGVVEEQYIPEVGNKKVIKCPIQDMRTYEGIALKKLREIDGLENKSFAEALEEIYGVKMPSDLNKLIKEKYNVEPDEVMVRIPGATKGE